MADFNKNNMADFNENNMADFNENNMAFRGSQFSFFRDIHATNSLDLLFHKTYDH